LDTGVSGAAGAGERSNQRPATIRPMISHDGYVL